MAEESKTGAEGATATEEGHAHEHDHDHEHDHEHAHEHRPKPIAIPRQELTEEARAKAEEETGKKIEDLAYTVINEENKPNSVLSLRFQVSADDFRRELDKFYESLRKEVTLPGYRKGKAPVRLIRIRMGREGDKDAMTDAGLNIVRQELGKRELKLVSDPQIVNWKIEDGQPLEVEVEFELEPKVELKDYKGISITVETREIGDDDVNRELEQLRQQFASQVNAPEDATVAEDTPAVTLDIHVESEAGKPLPHLTRENFPVRDIRRNLPPDLADKVIGLKAGDTVTVPIKGQRENRRGEVIEFTDTYKVTVKEIKETKLPELDDEFAKDLGEHDTLQSLKDQLLKDLKAKEEERQKNEATGKIVAQIIEKNPVEAPRSLVARTEYESVMQDSYQLQRMGLRLQDVVHDPVAYWTSQQRSAEFQVKQSLLLNELAKHENLEVTDEDLDKEINELAERTGRKPLAVRAKLEADKRLDDLRANLRSRKVYDFLLANNTVEKVAAPPPSEEKAEEKTEEKAEAKAEGGEEQKEAAPKKKTTRKKKKEDEAEA